MNHPMFYVFDIDGTILTTKHQILASTKVAMALLTQRDSPIMLASARPPLAMEPIVAELGLEPFYISLNGALVVRGGNILLDEAMDTQATQAVIERALQHRLSVNVYTAWDWFIQEVNPHSTREGEIVGFPAQIRDLATVDRAHKILVIGEPKEVLALQAELKAEVPEVVASRSLSSYLEVVSSGVSKAHALEVISEIVGIPLREVVVFGDGENDLPMFKVAGFGVAMGNSHPSLKKHAHLVTGTNDEDGILQAVGEILGLEV
jgi:hypothetical protein